MLRICDSTSSSITCLPRFSPNTAQRSRTSVSLVSGPLVLSQQETVTQAGAGAGAKQDKSRPIITSTSAPQNGVDALRSHLRSAFAHLPNMSSPDKSSPPRDGANGQDEKPRLTEEQKRQNHISSEQKRRQAIRDGFDKMASIVPGLEGQGRSEGHVLNVSVQFILEQVQERRRLVEQIEARGGVVSDELKAPLNVDLSKVNLEHLQQRNGSAGGPGM
ncbi:hypothetical protein FJTKL_13737 [Diaporthe vaccinii]|uniref:BHLH domain-containing protein n=1 Tax=Diaporthe vaccinii TaxID=105482 RepID=A0ABR4F8K9_9PEZI